MRRRLVAVAMVFSALASVAASCGGGGESNSGASEITGIVVGVTQTGGKVSAFALDEGDETHQILIAPDVDYGFALRHLYYHLRQRDPVVCSVERRRGALYALAIRDVDVAP